MRRKIIPLEVCLKRQIEFSGFQATLRRYGIMIDAVENVMHKDVNKEDASVLSDVVEVLEMIKKSMETI